MVAGLRTRAPGAVREFVERTHGVVYARACRWTLDEDLRRDWTHDCLLGVLDDLARGRFELRRPGGFWAWFSRRAHYLLLDRAREDQRRRERETARAPEMLAGQAGSDEEDPHADAVRREAFDAVRDCLDGLANARHREALAHHLLADLRYEEVADLMETSLNNIRTWIRRGRLALRECLIRRLALEEPPG